MHTVANFALGALGIQVLFQALEGRYVLAALCLAGAVVAWYLGSFGPAASAKRKEQLRSEVQARTRLLVDARSEAELKKIRFDTSSGQWVYRSGPDDRG